MSTLQPPALWDGFAFVAETPSSPMAVTYLDTMAQTHGQLPGLGPVADGRKAYHVILVSPGANGAPQLDHPFKTSFHDPVAYAEHMSTLGYRGIILRETQFSEVLEGMVMIQLISTLTSGIGFWYDDDESGKSNFYAGKLFGKEANQLP